MENQMESWIGIKKDNEMIPMKVVQTVTWKKLSNTRKQRIIRKRNYRKFYK